MKLVFSVYFGFDLKKSYLIIYLVISTLYYCIWIKSRINSNQYYHRKSEVLSRQLSSILLWNNFNSILMIYIKVSQFPFAYVIITHFIFAAFIMNLADWFEMKIFN